MNIVEKAKSFKTKRTKVSVSEDMAMLSVAFLEGEVTFTQVMKALECSQGSVVNSMLSGLKKAYKMGLLVKKDIK